jgi:dolichol-phosphate mannosyltransferase
MNEIEKIKLSVIIPCYNEEKTLKECLKRVLAIADERLELEVIIVDDASGDRSFAVAEELAAEHPQIIVFRQEKNRGKGAALRVGFKKATGDYAVVQDADLEYDPEELKDLLEPFVKHGADVVFGSRFLSGKAHRVLYFWHSFGNKFLTLLSNIFTNLNITDMETCYKMFRREIIQSVDIKENRFGFEPEIIAKIAKKKLNIYEVGISYYGRTYAEGKKIGWRDGWRALWCILKYNLFK